MSTPDQDPAFPNASNTIGHCSGMSMRQYAALKLKVPDSGEPWLDDMIRKSLLNDFAGQAMLELVRNHTPWDAADEAHAYATEMLKQMEQK